MVTSSELSYGDIGHAAEAAPVALWWIDRAGALHAEPAPLLDLVSQEPQAFEVQARSNGATAYGRVELERNVGSMCLPEGRGASSTTGILDRLEHRYPGTRWFVF